MSTWVDVIRRLSAHQTPEGFAKYGYMLENGGIPVGVLLMISTARVIRGATSIWCNGSSYYVEPAFRPYASALISRSHHFKGVTYLDLTPARHRWLSLEAQGYKQLARGVQIAIPALCQPAPGVKVRVITGTHKDDRLEPFETEALVAHAADGCFSIVCEYPDAALPFIFALGHKYGVPFAYLIYCRNLTDFISCAGSLGRFFAKRGVPLVILDADGPIAGIPGAYVAWLRKYWKGQERPRLGDLAFTELAMFGV